MHHSMKALMTENRRALANHQLELHLLLESRQILELQVPWDYEQKLELNIQAIEWLNQYQFNQELHNRQYWLVDSMSTESSFQLSSSQENWEMSNQVGPTHSTLSLGTYHISGNIPRLYQIQEGLCTWSWNALLQDNEGYKTFLYPRMVPTRRNRQSIEEMKKEGVEEARQPSNVEQPLAGVFNTGLEHLLLVLNFVQMRDRIAKMILEIMTMWTPVIDPTRKAMAIKDLLITTKHQQGKKEGKEVEELLDPGSKIT
ncbi:hypothetical protein HETIRDRAFT_426338 [Heterobasidion irregulare TC 32-1]|uniref:Uncharacterized protein n=1 Tax=Heterobasidion irregulare (strain TC 32-1) TaxID=747525 RepID=W4KCP7_HETIT|nr:uncharacterized protein HETIRDRAFT_426338 [Heterobasidion irregulare TC 32-1]ETW82826.1 hypothetical protein HETIRDRAFT_426338 [Heterobasidion irregulare TC 32-1]